jgi:hypothetical protein
MKNSEVRIVKGETKNPTECWSAGVMGRWSNLAAHLSAMSNVGFLNRRERRKRRGNPDSKSALRYLRLLLFRIQATPAQSSLIKPNRAILCLDAIQSQPPSCSKIATSPILLRQTPVKAGQSQSKCFRFVIFGPRFQPLSRYIVVPPAKCTSNGGCLLRWTLLCSQSAIRPVLRPVRHRPCEGGSFSEGGNPPSFAEPTEGRQSAIPPGSTWFHLVPLNSTCFHLQHPGPPRPRTGPAPADFPCAIPALF